MRRPRRVAAGWRAAVPPASLMLWVCVDRAKPLAVAPTGSRTHLEASSFLSRSTSPPAILVRASNGSYAVRSLMESAAVPQARTNGSKNFGSGDSALIAPGPAVHSRSSRGDCHNADGKGTAGSLVVFRVSSALEKNCATCAAQFRGPWLLLNI